MLRPILDPVLRDRPEIVTDPRMKTAKVRDVLARRALTALPTAVQISPDSALPDLAIHRTTQLRARSLDARTRAFQLEDLSQYPQSSGKLAENGAPLCLEFRVVAEASGGKLLEQGFDESIETLVAGDAVPAVQPT